jgi:hypothetical protein
LNRNKEKISSFCKNVYNYSYFHAVDTRQNEEREVSYARLYDQFTDIKSLERLLESITAFIFNIKIKTISDGVSIFLVARLACNNSPKP